jgi:DNA-binding winged helix-turn-helix (wHTH) protein
VKISSSVPPTFRFGVFELDPRSGELRKQGMKIRLQGQPVEILVILLERSGEIVSRDELQKKLWPADTFVDFEQGLNNAMKRLRAALDDDAETPRFIETLPRRGYRFVGSLNGAGQAPALENKPSGRLGPALRWASFGFWLSLRWQLRCWD